jgi:hypothetical protein
MIAYKVVLQNNRKLVSCTSNNLRQLEYKLGVKTERKQYSKHFKFGPLGVFESIICARAFISRTPSINSYDYRIYACEIKKSRYKKFWSYSDVYGKRTQHYKDFAIPRGTIFADYVILLEDVTLEKEASEYLYERI